MNILTKIRNWLNKQLDEVAVAIQQDVAFREDVAETTYQFCVRQGVDVNSRFLAHTPMLFRVELALVLSTKYGVTITVQDIVDAEDVDDLASTIMRKQYQRYRVIDPTLLASKSSNIIA